MTERRDGIVGAARWIVIAVPMLLAAGFYADTVNNGFAFDDLAVIVQGAGVKSWANVPALFSGDYYRLFGEATWRPATSFSALAEYSLWGASRPGGYHLTNIALHCLAVGLAAALALRLTDSPIAAVLTGLLFGILPVQAEAVNAISYREDLLSLVSVVGGLLLSLRYRERGGRGCYTLAMLAFLVALLSKETALMIVPALLAYEWLFGRPPRARMWRLAAGAALLTVAVLVISRIVIPNTGQFNVDTAGQREYWPTLRGMPGVFLAYIGEMVLPMHSSVVYSTAIPQSVVDPGFVLGVAAVLACVGLVWLLRKRPAASFGMAWFLIFLLPASNIVAPVPMRADRYLYLPLAGVALVIGSLAGSVWSGLGSRRRLGLAIAVAACVALWGTQILKRNRDWRSQLCLMRAAAVVAPDSAAPHTNLAAWYATHRNTPKALYEYQHALSIDDRRWETWSDYGHWLGLAHKYEEAEAALLHAIALSPNAAEAWVNLGYVLRDTGREADAIKVWETAVARDPSAPDAYYNIGNLLLHKGNVDGAEEWFRRTLGVAPGYALAHFQLGRICARRGDKARAREHLETAIRLGLGRSYPELEQTARGLLDSP
jgi:tetratricopeptide (TPR) repeat protein